MKPQSFTRFRRSIKQIFIWIGDYYNMAHYIFFFFCSFLYWDKIFSKGSHSKGKYLCSRQSYGTIAVIFLKNSFFFLSFFLSLLTVTTFKIFWLNYYYFKKSYDVHFYIFFKNQLMLNLFYHVSCRIKEQLNISMCENLQLSLQMNFQVIPLSQFSYEVIYNSKFFLCVNHINDLKKKK